MCQKGCYPVAVLFWVSVFGALLSFRVCDSEIKRAGGRAFEPSLAPPCGRTGGDPGRGYGGRVSYSQLALLACLILGRFPSRAQLPDRSDLLQTLGHEFLESERIEASLLVLQALLGFRTDFRTGQDPGQRRLRLAVNTPEAPGHPWGALFALQLQTGVKEVAQRPIGFLDQRIDQGHHFGVVVPFIAKALTDVRPVLLFDVRIVILFVGATARHEHGPGL